MEFDANEIRTLFTGLAVIVSLSSLWFSHRTWVRSNRPIIVAAIESEGGGNMAVPLNLVVMNSGNRPALRIRLHSKQEEIEKCLYEPNGRAIEKAIQRCFSEETEIPLLLDGKSVTNSFGFLSSRKEASSWVDKSVIPIRISYYDLDGRKFKSKLKLSIKDTMGFAGSKWGDSKNS